MLLDDIVEKEDLLGLFLEGSSTAEAARSVDWEATPVGRPRDWPLVLKGLVSVMSRSPIASIVLWGPELTTFHNDAYLPMLGSAFKPLLGQKFPEARPDVWPFHQPFVEAAMSGSAGRTEDLEVITERYGTPERAFFRSTYIPVSQRKSVAGVYIQSEETTSQFHATNQLRLENQQLKRMFDDAPIFLALGSAPDMRFQYVNKAYEKFVMRGDLVGRTVAEALPEVIDQGFLDLLFRACSTGEPVVVRAAPIRLQPDRNQPSVLKYCDFIFQPVDVDDGSAPAMLCTGYDVTEEHRVAVEAAELRDQLGQVHQSALIEGLASSFAHELNQPLAAGINYLQAAMLTSQKMSEEGAEKLRPLMEASQLQLTRAADIIRGLPALAGLRAHRREQVDLAILIKEARRTSRMAGVCPKARIQTCIGQPNRSIFGDPVQVLQVILNLMRNACDAAGPSASIRISTQAEGEQCVGVTVADNGPGFDREILASGPKVGSSTKGGLGVGLFLSKMIIEAHGGDFALENAPGGGALVHFTLPRCPDPAASTLND